MADVARPDDRPDSLGDIDHLTTTTRDPVDLGRRIGSWLAGRLPDGARPTVTDVSTPDANGMSSETILFNAAWQEDRGAVERRLVARIEPELDKLPVFPSYDLAAQFEAMSLVRTATSVPVPEPLWFEPDRDVLGAPFFVMARVDGIVPPDVLPYTFGDTWVDAGSREERTRLQRSAVEAVAGIHAITPATHDLAFLDPGPPGDTALERHLAHWEGYHRWVVGDELSPLLEESFTWLRDHLPGPGDLGPDCLSWGDARIGNMLFDDFRVVGVLDWEMAAIAPPEIDLGWMAYLHRFFQDIAADIDLPGLPDLLRPADIAATYGEITGRPVGDLRWAIAYAAIRHGVIMRRVTERAVLFGQAVRPDDVDDLILHRRTLAAIVDGTWDFDLS